VVLEYEMSRNVTKMIPRRY